MSEVETLAQLRGLSNVVHMDDHAVFEIRENGRLVGYDLLIRMELLENVGRSLRYHGGTLSSIQEVHKLGRDLSRGLICCHQKGILHRDINPNNILRNAFGDYKLGDFGIAKQLHGTLHAQTAIGTKRYVAPEVLHRGGQDAYDARADIYCLGLVLYQLANNGYLPFFHADMPKEQWEEAVTRRLSGGTLPPPAQADEAFSEVILKACAYRPEDRYASAQELYDALLRLAYPQQQTALVPQSQTGLLYRLEKAMTSTAELRSIAELLHLLPKQQQVQTDILSARMAARLPAWRIRASWFPFNTLLLRDYLSVAERAFMGRRDLASLQTGGRLQRIGAEAFAQCTSLHEVRCGSGLTEIEQNAFSGCAKLTRCQLPGYRSRAGKQRVCRLQDFDISEFAGFADGTAGEAVHQLSGIGTGRLAAACARNRGTRIQQQRTGKNRHAGFLHSPRRRCICALQTAAVCAGLAAACRHSGGLLCRLYRLEAV